MAVDGRLSTGEAKAPANPEGLSAWLWSIIARDVPIAPMQMLGLVVAVLALNSILAALGSVLFAHFPYWPAFMISALVASIRPAWGFALFIASPLLSTTLGIGGASSYAYLPVDALQAVMAVTALRIMRLDVGLPLVSDVVRYIIFVAFLPSIAGGLAGWYINQAATGGDAGLSAVRWVAWWSLENTLPVLFPGIWLHRCVGQFGRSPAQFLDDFRPHSWQSTVLRSIAPWLISLLLGCAVVVALVAREVLFTSNGPGSQALWQRVYAIAEASIVFRVAVLLLSISILVALGATLLFARRLWTMEEEVSRRLPYRLTDAPRGGRYHATVMFTDIRGFTEQSGRFPPSELVTWLNRYFDAMCDIALRHNGMVDKFIGDGLMLVFGLKTVNSGSRDAVACSLAMIEALEGLNQALVRDGYPPIKIGIGIHTGLIVAGEIGSTQRLQFTVIGNNVNIAARLESASSKAPEGAMPIVLSDATAVDAGLLILGANPALTACTFSNLKGLDAINAWFVSDGKAIWKALTKDGEEKTTTYG